MKKIIIVTGAAGFIGSHLANRLAETDDCVVYGIDNLAAGKKERLSNKVHFHQINITNLQSLATFFLAVSEKAKRAYDGVIYAVFHLAALPRVQYSIDHPWESHQVNVNGTLNVFLVAKEFKVRRVIYSASSSAYGNQTILPFREDMLPSPMSPYAAQKYFGEILARAFYEAYGLRSLCLRYFNVYGPGADPHGAYPQALIKFVYQRSQGLPLTVTGDGSQTRDSVHVRDVVLANVRAMFSDDSHCRGDVINIGSGNSVSVMDMAKMVGGEIQFIPPRIEPKHTQADITLAKRLLDWQPMISLEDGISELKMSYGIK